jgi:uncharacterized CHY-type Zn-finger protein
VQDVPRVLGLPVDDQTRCVHYRTPLDVVAIRFFCCGGFYPCHLCHRDTADHGAIPWPADDRTARSVLCGVCKETLAIAEYLGAEACPSCGAAFNPRCKTHLELYFET